MELRTAVSPRDVKHYTTERLREEFLISNLFPADEIRLVYSHIDRIITGGIMPVKETLVLKAGEELGNGQMIHCGHPVQYTSINSPYWQSHFYGFGRW